MLWVRCSKYGKLEGKSKGGKGAVLTARFLNRNGINLYTNHDK